MGVKQLWTLLAPVGRPVPLETLEGKILAIDSSIWLYQFQATMRDKDGRALVNAHILGFLRRISKLLFYGIKPVFVFDGGAPVLKRNTITERKKRKSGAAASHAKVAEKLLAAQLRREALRHTEAQGRKETGATSSPKNKQPANATSADDDNYLDDLSGPLLVLPGKHNVPPNPTSKPSSSAKNPPPPPDAASTSPTKKQFREHDPYRLPELDTASLVARTAPNDPRLATDEELRAYVSHLRPDDPEFHDLPPDAQYEILGELRLKSRTTSHRRLQKMLRQSKTPMDFSMAQIKNLGQRNRLTQEVLSTLDIVGTGKGGVVVPVKIASEKNREYVLVRNEGVDGGFTLGMRQEGNTADKPIVVEEEEGDEEGDDSFESKAGWEDVVVPGRSQIGVAPDQDWRDYKRENALAGLSKRETDKRLAPLTTKPKPVQRTTSAKDKGKGKEIETSQNSQDESSDIDLDDAQLQLAMHASLAGNQAEEDEDEDVQRALALSLAGQPGSEGGASSSGLGIFGPPTGIFGAPTGLLGFSTGLLDGDNGADDQDQDASSSPPQVVDVDGMDVDEDEMEMEEIVVEVPSTTNGRMEGAEWEDVEEPDDLYALFTPPPPAISSLDSTPSQKQTPPARTPLSSTIKPTPHREPTSRRSSATRRELAQALSSSGDEDEAEDVQLPSRLMTILAPYQTAVGGSPVKKGEGGDGSDRDNLGKRPGSAGTPGKGTVLGEESLSMAESPVKKSRDNVAMVPTKRVAWGEMPSTKSSPVTDLALPATPKASGALISTPVPANDLDDSDAEIDEIVTKDPSEKLHEVPSTSRTGDETVAKGASMPSWFTSAPTVGVSAPPRRDVLTELTQDVANAVDTEDRQVEADPVGRIHPGDDLANAQDESHELVPLELSDEDDDDVPVAWSRSPTPSGAQSPVMVPVHSEPDWDSARSRTSRLQAESEEHASFMSTLQGKSYAFMRESLDAEIAALRKERAAALRDAEDVTAQMSAQIQVLLRLFGVPFVNAPMEAEAQCAFLARRGLVEGVITDDSDVFLFGAGKVFRNMFNQSKTVECFFAADLERELGLDRETLIGLAYLLGSDYTEGLQGVGPVVAMEIMKEFPGEDGLSEFTTWWRKVQVGRDNEADLRTTFRKRFKKKFKTLHLTDEWPNPKVREAYLDPAVDPSEEKFQWGLPDLDGLRQFLGEELLWNASKVDETILPIIRRMTQRSSASAANKQGTLTSFLDVSGNTLSNGATYAPRKRQAYASKRLQQVVSEYRARKAGEDVGDTEDGSEPEPEAEKTKPKKVAKPRAKGKGKNKVDDAAEVGSQDSGAGATGSKRKRATGGTTRGKRGSGRARGAGRGRGRGRGRANAAAQEEEDAEASVSGGDDTGEQETEAPAPKKPRLRPRMKMPSPVPRQAKESEGESGSSDEYVGG